MTLLFLDADGVTHPETADVDELFSCNEHLWTILRACPQVRVVFSTSWREAHTLENLIELVTHGGGEDLVHRFIGANPQIIKTRGAYTSAVGDYSREQECQLWLLGNGMHDHAWLAIDDIGDWFSPGSPNLYKVNYQTGLTEDDARAIITMLNGESK